MITTYLITIFKSLLRQRLYCAINRSNWLCGSPYVNAGSHRKHL